MGDCQNYGPFLGPYSNTGPNTGPNLGDPKTDHNFDNPPGGYTTRSALAMLRAGAGAWPQLVWRFAILVEFGETSPIVEGQTEKKMHYEMETGV